MALTPTTTAAAVAHTAGHAQALGDGIEVRAAAITRSRNWATS